jgi:poly-gamma-glutamate synthesis protein (capsule biosynthesis protein)
MREASWWRCDCIQEIWGGSDAATLAVGAPDDPAPEMAQKILEKVQRISKPFGTTISIENNVGVIRGAPG